MIRTYDEQSSRVLSNSDREREIVLREFCTVPRHELLTCRKIRQSDYPPTILLSIPFPSARRKRECAIDDDVVVTQPILTDEQQGVFVEADILTANEVDE